jgi:hypothetical protein
MAASPETPPRLDSRSLQSTRRVSIYPQMGVILRNQTKKVENHRHIVFHRHPGQSDHSGSNLTWSRMAPCAPAGHWRHWLQPVPPGAIFRTLLKKRLPHRLTRPNREIVDRITNRMVAHGFQCFIQLDQMRARKFQHMFLGLILSPNRIIDEGCL